MIELDWIDSLTLRYSHRSSTIWSMANDPICERCGTRGLPMARGCYKCYRLSNQDADTVRLSHPNPQLALMRLGIYVASSALISMAAYSFIFRLMI